MPDGLVGRNCRSRHVDTSCLENITYCSVFYKITILVLESLRRSLVFLSLLEDHRCVDGVLEECKQKESLEDYYLDSK